MRKLSLVFMVLMMLAMGSVVAAQDVPCGDLSEEDCTFLADTAAAMATVDSASFTIEANISTTAEDESSEITITGDGAFSGVAGMLSGAMTGMSDPAAATDTAAMMEAFTAGLGNFDGAINLAIDADGQELEIQLVLVDSVGYVNFGALGLAGMQLGQDATLPEWGGVNLIDLLGTAMTGMPIDETMENMTENAGVPEGFDPNSFSSYLVVTRVEDQDWDGTNVAVFETTLDLAGMMNDPAMQEMMAESGEELTEEQMQTMMAAYENIQFTLTSYIGTDDNLVYGVELDLAVDAAAMAEAAGEEDEAEDAGTVAVTFGLYFADYNDAPAIAAPEGAVVAEAEELMQMFGMMFAGSMGQ